MNKRLSVRMSQAEAAVEATQRWSAAILALRELQEMYQMFPEMVHAAQSLFSDHPETAFAAAWSLKRPGEER